MFLNESSAFQIYLYLFLGKKTTLPYIASSKVLYKGILQVDTLLLMFLWFKLLLPLESGATQNKAMLASLYIVTALLILQSQGVLIYSSSQQLQRTETP